MFETVKTMEELKATFNIAIANKRNVVVLVKLPGLEVPEEIRNPQSNIRAKLDYYTKTYTSDLKMRNNEAIRIVDCYIDYFNKTLLGIEQIGTLDIDDAFEMLEEILF